MREYFNQYQMTHGTPPPQGWEQSIAEAAIKAQGAEQRANVALNQRQQEIDIQKGAVSDQRRAATVSGVASLAQTGILAPAAYKYMTGSSLVSDVKSGLGFGTGTVGGGTAFGSEAPVGAALETGSGAGGALSVAGPAAAGAALLYEGGKYVKKETGLPQWASTAVAPIVAPTMFLANLGKSLFTGGSKNTIICTELHRQGRITDRQRRYGLMYGKQVGYEVYAGYLNAAWPVVERMRESKWYSRLVELIAKPTIREIAHRVNPREKGSIFGSIVLHFGIRICLRVYDEKSAWIDSAEYTGEGA
jgi:hypothetical protein